MKEATTSNEVLGKIGFKVVGIISNYGECSILIENQDSYEWVEAETQLKIGI